MGKQTILQRRTGYALLLLLIAIQLSCSTPKLTNKLPYSPINGDLTFLTDQSRVGEILVMLSKYSLSPDVLEQIELVKSNEHLLLMTVHIQFSDDLQLNQIESRLAGANCGITYIRFKKGSK
jgi:hypothetical protein